MSDLSKRLAALPPEKRALLAERLQKEAGRQAQPALQMIPKRTFRADGKYPLSSAQKRLWFLHQLNPDSPTYNMPLLMLRLRGNLHLAALEQSLQQLQMRHEVLRTSFVAEDGVPHQRIYESSSLELVFYDLTVHPEAEREALLEQQVQEEAGRPFDLEAPGGLIRATLLKIAEQDHALILMQHHIIADGPSTGVLISDLGVLYSAAVEEKPAVLPEMSVQYADYSEWQVERLESAEIKKQLDYWLNELEGPLPVLELPHDRPRAKERIYKGEKKYLYLPLALKESLHSFCRQEGITPFMALLAAFNTLLYRYTGQEDILVGSVITNRSRAELQPLIGFFINTMVLRTDLSGSPSFRQLAARVRDKALDGYANQDLPFEKLVEELLTDRDQGHNALFNVMFAYQTVEQSKLSFSGLDAELKMQTNESTRNDLLFSLVEWDTGIRALLEYDTDLLSGEFVEQLFRHFHHLLHAALQSPDTAISELSYLDAAEQEGLLSLHGATRPDLISDTPLHRLFEEQAERSPDRQALVYEGTVLTYRELNERANVLARQLLQKGVTAEQVVGIRMNRTPELVIAVLAVLKAGGAYLPIDPKFPAARVNYMLADTGARLLLLRAADESSLEINGEVLAVDADTLPAGDADTGNLDTHVSAEQLAYVMYTSGSTGQPKGVQIEHRSIVHYSLSIAEQFGMQEEESHTFTAALTADAGKTAFYPSLLTGGTLHLLSEDLVLDPHGMAEYFAQHKIDWLKIAPSHLLALHNEVGAEQILPKRGLVIGGEGSRFDWVRSLTEAGSCAVYNHYGPTETTVGVMTYHAQGADLEQNFAMTPLQQPLANTEIYVLDDRLQPVPAGVPGILYIGGPCLARGYHNRPELTAERFIPHPFGGKGHLYNSGDLVRRLNDGKIEFLGRLDDQVKIRGYRVELGEVQAALAQHPAVKEAALLTYEAQPGDKRLYACVALRDTAVTAQELTEYLAERMPEHMVPSAILLVETLPRTVHGKIDRTAMPTPLTHAADADTEAEDSKQADTTSTQVEEILEGIFCQVLSVPKVELQDNFFKLGGHSLLATQVLSRIRKAFGVKLPLRTLFDTPTLGGIVELVKKAVNSGKTAELPPIQPTDHTGSLPLSFAQQRLWFLNQFDPASPFYNMPTAMKLNGPLNREALAESLSVIVVRHSSLRTVFHAIDGSPYQVIQAAQPVEILYTDFAEIPAAEREEAARRQVTDDSRLPFDLTTGPLFRTHLYRLGENEHVLLLNMHHIISDGWSNGILLRELKQLYSLRLQGGTLELSETPLQYADFALWQRDFVQGELLDEQLNYWVKQLEGAPDVLNLPTDRQRQPVQNFRGQTVVRVLDAGLAESLQEFSRKQGVTLYMTLLAAFQTLLFRYSGQEDILVGSPVAGRNRAEIEEVFGFFINTLVMRGTLNGDMSFEKLLKKTRDVTLSAFQNQDLPYDKLVETLQPERSLSYNPLIQTAFTLNSAHGSFSLPGLDVQGFGLEWTTSKLDLSLVVVPRHNTLAAVFEYNTDLFDAETMERMIGNFEVLLQGIISTPGETLSKLPLLTEQERHKLLVEWNDTSAPVPTQCIHQVFEASAARLPDHIALIFNREEMTYRELNERANRLARHLRALNIQKGDVIGICLERSAEIVVAILAALKAGAVYVPLDPLVPGDRLSFQIEDAEMKAFISQDWLLEGLPVEGLSVVRLAEDQAVIDSYEPDNLNLEASVEDLAYIIYTSGSTGRPKGVLIRHIGVVNVSFAAKEAYNITEQSRMAQFATVSFDASVWQMFTPLHLGATLCLVTREEQVSAEAFAKMARYVKLTWLDGPPILFDAMEPEQVPDLKTTISGGERLPLQIARKWSQDRDFYNGFGPTETTVITSWHLVKNMGEDARNVPIGRPINNTQMYVLDRHMQPVPIGVPGELYIGGIGLAVGYWKREDLTAEKFVPHPFREGERLYKSGDLVRMQANGILEHLGRVDYQVKIRGFRIEPEEIEVLLNAHPTVAESAVMTPEDKDGHKQLVVYYVPAIADFSVDNTKAFLRSKLPEYMVPQYFVELDKLPRAHNNKVDRHRLPAFDMMKQVRETPYEAPQTPEEQLLVDLFAEVLKRGADEIGLHDNFFQIGGHSLLATQLVSRIREAFQVELPLLAMFETPTPSELLRAVLVCKLEAAEGLGDLLSDLDGLTDEEVEELLAAELAAESKN